MEGEVSDFIKLSPQQMTELQRMGFCDGTYEHCDSTDDGVISIEDQTDAFSSVSGYEDAFVNLAILGGDPRAIDALDLAMLAKGENLAEVIAADPAYHILKARHTGLQHNVTEISPDGLYPGVPPRHYRRLTYYTQMALAKVVDPSLVPDGIYGNDTRRVVYNFQEFLKIENGAGEPAEGRIAGPLTIGTLIMRLRYSKYRIKAMLSEDAFTMSENNDSFKVDSPADRHEGIYEHILIALKWLGYVKESVTSDKKIFLTKVIQKKFSEKTKGKDDGVIDLVGPKVIDRIIDRVEDLNIEPGTLKAIPPDASI